MLFVPTAVVIIIVAAALLLVGALGGPPGRQHPTAAPPTTKTSAPAKGSKSPSTVPPTTAQHTSTTSATAATTTLPVPQLVPEEQVALYFDGWAAKTIAKLAPTYQVDATYSTTASPTKRLDLRPVKLGTIKTLATTAPGLLSAVTSQMVSVNADVSCSATKCTAGGVQVPFSQLANAGSVPDYGAAYRAWGIGSAIYEVDLTVPTSTQSVIVRARGWQPYQVVLTSLPLPTGVAPSAVNGYGAGDYLLGAAFGRFFAPEVGWANAKQGPYSIAYLPGKDTKPSRLPSTDPPFSQGLAVPEPIAAGLTPSALTDLSAPTTGCALALCVPGTAHPKITHAKVAGPALACAGKNTKAYVTEVDSRWSYNFPGPTPETGMWDGKHPAQFQGHLAPAGPGMWSGYMPLVSGPTTMRVVQYVLSQGTPATAVYVPSSNWQVGVDPPSQADATYPLSWLSTLTSGQWHLC